MQANLGFVSAECLRRSLTTFHLYVLRDPDTNQVRYVGCCERPSARLSFHVTGRNCRSKVMRLWIDRLTAGGKRPVMDVQFTCIGLVAARVAEQRLIDHWFSIVGQELLNSQGIYNFFSVDRLRAKAKHLRDEIDRSAYWAKWHEEHGHEYLERCRRKYGIEHNGVYKMLAEWAKDLGITRQALWTRLKTWPKERALSTPKMN